jgi:hypothetical protein
MSGVSAWPHGGPVNLPGSYLVLELTNRCPLLCGHCAVAEADQGHPHYERIEHMQPGMVRELLQDLAVSGLHFDNLVLFWLGEPLSNPDFPEIYDLVLRETGRGELFGKVEVHTNTFPLAERVAEGVLNDLPLPQVWHLTMDAIRRETYRVIKGVDAFAQSQRQATRMVRLKGERRARWPKLAMQFIVSDVNAAEAPEFVDYWKGVFRDAGLPVGCTGFHVPVEGPEDWIFLKSLDCPTPEEQERQNRVYVDLMRSLGLRSPVDPDAARRVESEIPRTNLRPCSGFWKSPTVASDGRLTVCTRDNPYHLVLGSLRERSFSDMWLSDPVLNRRRQLVADGDYSELPFCQTCFIPSSVNYSGITDGEIQSFQRALGLAGHRIPREPGLPRYARPFPDSWANPHPAQVYGERTGERIVELPRRREVP